MRGFCRKPLPVCYYTAMSRVRHRNWPILVVGFGALLVLILAFGINTLNQAQQIFREITAIHEDFRKNSELLNEIRMSIYQSGILARDYLLDTSLSNTEYLRKALRQLHLDISDSLRGVGSRLGSKEMPSIDRLRQEVDVFMNSLEPIYAWTAAEKAVKGGSFLRTQVIPRRATALSIAEEIAALNKRYFLQQEELLRQQQKEFSDYLQRMLVAAFLFGLAIALLSIWRVVKLESRAEAQYHRTEQAEQQLRHLSMQLVQAQEEERKRISRDLHDEVGQMLTGIRMELGNLEQIRLVSPEKYSQNLEEARNLSEQTLRTVRDISMGLRPSMLDDLGLAPALEWLARDCSRRSGLNIVTHIDGNFEQTADIQRTCVYRIIQEALTNCVRHAKAKNVWVTVDEKQDCIHVEIKDDGIGIPTGNRPRQGVGLLGIGERTRELGGNFQILSQPGAGTRIQVEIPLGKEGKI